MPTPASHPKHPTKMEQRPRMIIVEVACAGHTAEDTVKAHGYISNTACRVYNAFMKEGKTQRKKSHGPMNNYTKLPRLAKPVTTALLP